MVLRFYTGGPQAIRGTVYWRTRNRISAVEWVSGCWIAWRVGAHIPRDTYGDADPHLSQERHGWGGVNRTALLPIEE